MKNNLLKKIWLIVGLLCVSMAVFACGKDDINEKNNENIENTDVAIETEDREDSEDARVQQGEIVFTYPLLIVPENMDHISSCIESDGILMISGGHDGYNDKWVYYNKFGETIGDDAYERAYPFTEGVAVVHRDGKYGFIDINGEDASDFVYDDLSPYSEGLAYFAIGDEYGFMNKDGSVAFYLDCDSVSSFSEGKAYFSIDGKYGYIDTTGNCVISAEYSDADYFREGLAFVTIDGYKGAINDKGEVVIPIQYGVLVREDGYIYGKIGDQYDYFSLNGESILEAEAQRINEEFDNEAENSQFTVNIADGRFVVYDRDETEVLAIDCDYAYHSIYKDDVNYILDGVNDKDAIVLLEENVEKDMSELLLKNSITPRKRPYFDAVLEMEDETDYAPELCLNKIKFYDIDNSGEPVLYYFTDSIAFSMFPMSDSAFFVMDGNEVKTLIRGNECGGSMRGDYVCFWKNMDTGELALGKDGTVGGFGGIAVYSLTYEYKNKDVAEVLYFHMVEQPVNNYDSEELINNAHMFYDSDGNPLTPETIMDAEYVTEYTLNDVRVTAEEYANAARYKYFSLY